MILAWLDVFGMGAFFDWVGIVFWGGDLEFLLMTIELVFEPLDPPVPLVPPCDEVWVKEPAVKLGVWMIRLMPQSLDD